METTSAAISTAMSESGIGIIRVSGPEAVEIVSRIYRSKGGKKDINKCYYRKATQNICVLFMLSPGITFSVLISL